MKKEELRTIRVQILLTAGLFLGCVVLAAGIATQRAFFEKYLFEKYATSYESYPAALQRMADAIGAGEANRDEFATLDLPQRLALYEDWITRREPVRPLAPQTLVALEPTLYLDRAVQTVVSGNRQQRLRAVQFLESSRHEEAITKLEKLRAWAGRRMLDEVAKRVDEALRKGKSTTG